MVKMTKKEADRLLEKYQGYQLFDIERVVPDDYVLDDEFDRFEVRVCYDYEYIEVLGVSNVGQYLDLYHSCVARIEYAWLCECGVLTPVSYGKWVALKRKQRKGESPLLRCKHTRLN